MIIETTATINQLSFFSPDDKPFGRTWQEWTIRWWQWILGSPGRGRNLGTVGTDDPNVIFLMGGLTIVSEEISHIDNEYRLAIPSGKALLFPTMNAIMTYLDDKFKRDMHTEQDLVNWVKKDQDDIVVKQMTLNAQIVDGHRIFSPPFDLTLPAQNNIYGISVPCTTRAAADGFWIFLRPLPIGEYDIHTAGACAAGRTRINADYHITVQ